MSKKTLRIYIRRSSHVPIAQTVCRWQEDTCLGAVRVMQVSPRSSVVAQSCSDLIFVCSPWSIYVACIRRAMCDVNERETSHPAEILLREGEEERATGTPHATTAYMFPNPILNSGRSHQRQVGRPSSLGTQASARAPFVVI